MFYISNTNTLKSIYFASFHSIIKYGIIFGGNFFQHWKDVYKRKLSE